MTAIEFLRRYRPGSLVKSSARGEYQLAEHDSFKINGESSVWHWKSRDIGGKSALKYLIYVEGVPFVEAVQLLCEESPMYIPVQHEAVERERPQFKLPRKAPTNDRVTRYLLGRGISLPTIRYCIARKILYESAEYHNCVFLGKDPQGVPKYAALRGIYDYGKPFKREAPGSQKQYGFCIPPMQPGTTVAVFEAAIDAMAEMTLCGDAADKYRLSLGGVSSSGKEPLALQEFLRQHPEITTIELRLDNDAKGRMASVGIRKIYADRYTVHDLPPNIENGDYADAVVQDNAIVCDGYISGNSCICGNAILNSDEQTRCAPMIGGNARVYGELTGNVVCQGSAIVLPGVKLYNTTADCFVLKDDTVSVVPAQRPKVTASTAPKETKHHENER